MAGNYDDSVRVAAEEARSNGWYVVSDTSYNGYLDVPRAVMSGYGVMVDEVVRELGDKSPPSHVFLQGGVGGMAASVAAYLRQCYGERAPRVVIVEPELADCLYRSARAGRQTEIEVEEETIMAGLSCGAPSLLAWEILREEASDYLTIPDNIIAPAMRLLAFPEKAGGAEVDPVIEGGESGVAGLAGLIAVMMSPALAEAMALDQSSRVLLVGSEGATDAQIYDAILADAA